MTFFDDFFPETADDHRDVQANRRACLGIVGGTALFWLLVVIAAALFAQRF